MTSICAVRDRVRTKMERDILAEMRHPFIVTLEYGELLSSQLVNTALWSVACCVGDMGYIIHVMCTVAVDGECTVQIRTLS